MRGSDYAYTTRRGERRWRVVFDALPDPLTGEQRQTSKRGFATKAAAEAFLRRSIAKVTAGTYTQPSRVTVAEYLAAWLDGLRKKPTTMADYRQSARVYIGPRIGGVPLQSLTPEHLDRLYRELETQGKRAGRCATAGVTCRAHGCSPDRHGGLSPKSVRNVHGMLHRALQEAAERGHVPRNVASDGEAGALSQHARQVLGRGHARPVPHPRSRPPAPRGVAPRRHHRRTPR